MHRVFVYGTLKSGHGNNRLLRGQTYLGRDVAEGRYTMVDLGAFPGIVVAGEPGRIIVGEVYDVSTEGLESLDRLEGHPDFYARSVIPLREHGEGWAYFLPAERYLRRGSEARVIESGCWDPCEDEQRLVGGLRRVG